MRRARGPGRKRRRGGHRLVCCPAFAQQSTRCYCCRVVPPRIARPWLRDAARRLPQIRQPRRTPPTASPTRLGAAGPPRLRAASPRRHPQRRRARHVILEVALREEVAELERQVEEFWVRRAEDAMANEKMPGIFASHEQRWFAKQKALQRQVNAIIAAAWAHEEEVA
ncbi:hypothetical protein ACP70R_042195 [Stipagrostis hirtigluma subsp. patula]